ncbi:MAG: hypothetical protein HC818_04345 [Synechococcaceae cyanobacterium RM1_1_27]|nr:hypothetical protein [Synechococcaceae cyanobacterium RM1_1_27]
MPSSPDHQAQVRDFYEEIPYPNAPIPDSVRNNLDGLFKVNYTTAQYLRTHQIQDNEGTVMLNAGCGSGYETLLLAESNPGAKIIAMDISRDPLSSQSSDCAITALPMPNTMFSIYGNYPV